MNDCLFIDKEGLVRLPLLNRANIKGGLKYDDYLSLSQITDLICPIYAIPKDEEKKRLWRENRRMMQASKASHQREIIKACKKGLIIFEGNIDGWTFTDNNPYPLAKAGIYHREITPHENWITGEYVSGKRAFYECLSYHCTIHRDKFKRYWQLPNDNPHPINDLLANWFGISLSNIQQQPAIFTVAGTAPSDELLQ